MRSLIRSIACSICKAFGGHPIEQPSDIGKVAGSSPRTSYPQKPSPAWLENRLPDYGHKDMEQPTYNVDHLIQHIRYRIGIHETYWGLVDDDPATWLGFGSVEFQQWAIEGYENTIFYLKRLEG